MVLTQDFSQAKRLLWVCVKYSEKQKQYNFMKIHSQVCILADPLEHHFEARAQKQEVSTFGNWSCGQHGR